MFRVLGGAVRARACAAPARAFAAPPAPAAADIPPPTLLDAGSGGAPGPGGTAAACALHAFYSSHLGGVTRDPARAALPVDDHGFHRGHCVFDTCNVNADGDVYALDMHLDRLAVSAAAARIPLPPRASLRAAVLGTVAAAGRRRAPHAFVRYWLTAGRGDFAISPAGCGGAPGFFVVVHPDTHAPEIPLPAVAAVTSDVPLKPPLLATMKTNNYLLNALVAMDAEARGADFGIQTQTLYGGTRRWITESSVSTVGVVLQDDNDGDGGGLVFVVPPFDAILASTTAQRAMALLPDGVDDAAAGRRVGLRLERRNIDVEELAGAREVIDFGGHFCRPVGSVDGAVVGGDTAAAAGAAGGVSAPGRYPVYEALATALAQDMASNVDLLDKVPWGGQCESTSVDESTPRLGPRSPSRTVGYVRGLP